MKLQVEELEHQYERLCSITTAGGDDTARNSSFRSSTTTLRTKYEQARDEATALRTQIAAMKERLVEFDRFEAAVTTSVDTFAMPSQLHEPPDPFEPLSEEACFAIIQQCYQQIFFPQWRGTRVSTGAQLFGWRDERFVDGTTLQFALSKTFTNLAMEHMMVQTWNIVTQEAHKHTVQKTTIGVKTLQVINDDVLITQRCVHHPQLSTVTCVNLLMFRLRTERGYVVAYVTIDHPSPPTSPTSSRHTSRQRRSGNDGAAASSSRTMFVDIDEFTNEQRSDKAVVSWVDTLQWFLFEDAVVEPAQATSPPVYEIASPFNHSTSESLNADDAEMDDDLMGFAASLMDQPSPPSAVADPMFTTEDDDGDMSTNCTTTTGTGTGAPTVPEPSCPPSPSSPAPPASSSAVNVTFGGRTDNKDLHYVSYFLIEVVSMIVRWDQAVAYSRLPFSVDSSDDNASVSPPPSPFAFVVGRDTSEEYEFS